MFCTEVCLLLAGLVLTGASIYLLKANLLYTLGIRKYSVGREVSADKLAKDEAAVKFALQEAYCEIGGTG